MLTTAISLLALLATFYQLYLQRIHNEKSLKPLPQIDFLDRKNQIFIHIQNNGVGPFVIDRLIFVKDTKSYDHIEQCLDLNPKTFMHMRVTSLDKKTVLPENHLEVFSIVFEEDELDSQMDQVREQLAGIRLKVKGRDIYDNRIDTDRSFEWFVRHNSNSVS